MRFTSTAKPTFRIEELADRSVRIYHSGITAEELSHLLMVHADAGSVVIEYYITDEEGDTYTLCTPLQYP